MSEITMNHNHDPANSNETESLRIRDTRFRRALAGLLIGSGVIAGGAYVTLDNILNKETPTTQEQPSTTDSNLKNNPQYDPQIVPGSWPTVPKTPLPPPEILDKSQWGN